MVDIRYSVKTVDWDRVRANAKILENSALEYVIQDCSEAVEASKGWNPENENYYTDLRSVYSAELRSRK